jgi:hypothetical protein
MFGSVLMVPLGVAIHRVSYQRRSEVKEIAVTSRCVTAEDSMIPRFHERGAGTDRYVYLLECQTRPQCITGRRTKQDEKEDTIVDHTITIPLLPHSSTPTKLSIQCDPTDTYPRSIDIAFVFADHTTATTQYWISNLPSRPITTFPLLRRIHTSASHQMRLIGSSIRVMPCRFHCRSSPATLIHPL